MALFVQSSFIVLLVTTSISDRFLSPFGLQLCDFPDTGRGVQTKRHRTQGEILLEVPLRDTITSTSLFREIPQLDTHQFSDQQRLALGLVRKVTSRRKGSKTIEDAYIASLPRTHASLLTMPDQIWDNCQSFVPRSYRDSMLATRQWGIDLVKTVAQDHRELFDQNNPSHLKEDILWACSMVRSRSIAVPELATDCDEIPHALIPGLDQFNHKFGVSSKLELVSTSSNEQHWKLLSESPYQKDDQVWLSYGEDKDNLEIVSNLWFLYQR